MYDILYFWMIILLWQWPQRYIFQTVELEWLTVTRSGAFCCILSSGGYACLCKSNLKNLWSSTAFVYTIFANLRQASLTKFACNFTLSFYRCQICHTFEPVSFISRNFTRVFLVLEKTWSLISGGFPFLDWSLYPSLSFLSIIT